jgi:hypothetical protein
MASSGNFCTLNPLTEYNSRMNKGNYSNGNLTYDDVGGDGWICNMAMTVKTYCELRIDSIQNYAGVVGLRGIQANAQTYDSVTFQSNYSSGQIYHYKGSSDQSYSGNIGGTVSAGSIVMMAYDPATYKWWVGVNGTWRNSGDPANGTGYIFEGSATMFENMNVTWGGWSGDVNRLDHTWNFGQDSTFGGQETAGGNADENGFGDFKYSPPTGFLALCTGNMSVSDDIDPAQTDDDYPDKQFGVTTYSGTLSSSGVAQITHNLGFKPDFIWSKGTTAGQRWAVRDSTRGPNQMLASDEQTADTDKSGNGDMGSTFATDTTFPTNYTDGMNASSGTFVAHCWRANGGTTTSFSAGGNQLAGTYQANTKSKFSIITYTGSGSANSEVLHGLGATPNFIIYKARNDTHWWGVYHKSGGTVNTGYDSLVYLNSTNAVASGQNVGIVPDSTKIVMSGNEQINRSSSYNYVMYAWADVEGMQKFGTYTGNGNSDGPFVYTGFRPAMYFVKNLTASNGWFIFDKKRDGFNDQNDTLSWQDTSAEDNTYKADILSNGFKVRDSNNATNQSGQTFIYGAWADVPFKYNNTR